MNNAHETATTFILFGATGDLAKKRIIPAIYSLFAATQNNNYLVITTGLEMVTAQEILQNCLPYISNFNDVIWQHFSNCFHYCPMDISQEQEFEKFSFFIRENEKNSTHVNRLFYLSVHTKFFASITASLAQVKILDKMKSPTQLPWHRVVYEKPFGLDSGSAQTINERISKYLQEFQIFRIDHYLAKDIIGTIALLRFTNITFEPLWNNQYIDWIEVVLSQTESIEGRGSFYDECGAIKDVVQNHIVQIIALLAMEEPVHLTGDFIRDQKTIVLQKIEPIDGILGQYVGYKNENGVAPDSTTETFAAIKLMINNPRWRGVPFYIRTGKCLSKDETLINIQFKPVKCLLAASCPSDANYLTIRVMPNSGFDLALNIKKPGLTNEVVPVTMNFCYECKFNNISQNVYELILNDVLLGEQAISVRLDEIEYAWDIIDHLEELSLPLYSYQKDSTGPEELLNFAKKNNMRWRL